MKTSIRVGTRLLTVVLVALSLAACSDDPEPNNNGITPGADATTDTVSDTTDDTSTDTTSDGDDDGQTLGPCAGVTCDGGEECLDGACVPVSSADACDIPRDLGLLGTDGTSTTVNLRMEGRTDSLQTGCGASDVPEGAIKFRTQNAAKIELGLNSGVGFGYEIRTADCESADSALACLTNDTHTFYTAAGLDYYLILEPTDADQIAPVEVTLTATEVACAPPGASSCDGTTREICFVTEGIQSRECADACDAGYCTGDTCSDLITVSASASFSGDSDAYRNRFDFSGEPSCSSGGTTGLSSPGYDVAFQLEALTAGQTVTVDATNTNADNFIFVLETCSEAGPCLTGQGFGSKLSNWEVPSDGDYVVVVDQSERTNVPFQIDIDIQ
ncbi:MAG: hypothetical protein ACQEVA_13510 [Myxococcota bacterium]